MAVEDDPKRLNRTAAVKKGHTEYGGGDGYPQRLPDGSAKKLTVGEEAFVVRSAGLAPDVESNTPVLGESAAATAARNRLRARTNRYAGDEGGE